jgi:hypothetical protein
MENTSTESLLRLLMIEKNLSPILRNAINKKAKKFLKSLKDDVGDFLHYDMDDEEHSEDDIRTLVQCVPHALSHQLVKGDGCWDFPIGGIALHNTECISTGSYRQIGLSLIPVLADEGMKLNVFEDDMRGGLLCKDNDGSNELWRISACGFDESSDLRLLDVIKRLREMGLFKKEDIRKYNLLHCSKNEHCSKRFNYFANWDPSALKYTCPHMERDPIWLLHVCRLSIDPHSFQSVLNATLRHYPHDLVQVLFLRGTSEGNITFQTAEETLGKKEALKLFENPTFQTAGETLGKKEALALFENCLDAETNGSKVLFEKNPKTNMYAFMVAAAGDTSDLDMVYYLLRRNPLVLDEARMWGYWNESHKRKRK